MWKSEGFKFLKLGSLRFSSPWNVLFALFSCVALNLVRSLADSRCTRWERWWTVLCNPGTRFEIQRRWTLTTRSSVAAAAADYIHIRGSQKVRRKLGRAYSIQGNLPYLRNIDLGYPPSILVCYCASLILHVRPLSPTTVTGKPLKS